LDELSCHGKWALLVRHRPEAGGCRLEIKAEGGKVKQYNEWDYNKDKI